VIGQAYGLLSKTRQAEEFVSKRKDAEVAKSNCHTRTWLNANGIRILEVRELFLICLV